MISTSMNNVPVHEFLSAPSHCTVYLIYIITVRFMRYKTFISYFMYLFYVQQQYEEGVIQDKAYPIPGPKSVELSSDGRTVSSNEHYECISQGKGEGEVHSPQKS